jgi:divalent metal cation (Fe/Co/Zn/Cd) transporter
LGLTALFQLGIVAISGSVALFADTVHNFSDALTAVPCGSPLPKPHTTTVPRR